MIRSLDPFELKELLVAEAAEAERHCAGAQRDGADGQEQFWAGASMAYNHVIGYLRTGHWAGRVTTSDFPGS